MPFVQVNFSGLSRAEAMDHQLSNAVSSSSDIYKMVQLKTLDKPITITRRFLGVWNANNWKKYIQIVCFHEFNFILRSGLLYFVFYLSYLVLFL